ncbi:DUF6585 family protein [Pseudonocardia sp. TRM90224]|uniref:DUF6585 family protein n=1 Tax=Pseudonocardia sp. TRM90224 TaxID=2812678 RepID=UPI001E45102F|nr:DUF6585 family protein [Pseudonocardia sp. TRM90224]
MSSADNKQGRLARIVWGLVVGLVLVGIGGWFTQPDSPPTYGAIECDGEVMGPGDKCVVIRGGGEDFTYESEQARRASTLASWRDEPGDELVGWVLIGAGALAAAAGVVAGVRRKDTGLRAELAAMPAVPPEVAAFAAEHGFGGRSLTHRAETNGVWGVLIAGVIFAAVTFALLVGPGKDGGWLILAVLFCGAIALMCFGQAGRAFIAARTDLYLFDHGLVHARGDVLTAFPWRETQIRRSVVKERDAPKPAFRYWLQRTGGPTVELHPRLELDEFGPEMEQRFTVERVPVDLDAIVAGHQVQYGPFAVDHAALTTRKGIIAWSELRAVELQNGEVRVWVFGADRAETVEVSKVPDVFVFLAVVDALRAVAQRAS